MKPRWVHYYPTSPPCSKFVAEVTDARTPCGKLVTEDSPKISDEMGLVTCPRCLEFADALRSVFGEPK